MQTTDNSKKMKHAVLQRLNILSLNEMQEASICSAQQKDVVVLAPTGSGKTLAFLLPILERMSQDINGIQALILIPSSELAQQIE